MNSFIVTLAGLFFVYATVITTVYCVDFRDVKVTKEERIALTRDHFGRTDPDELLNGFFPVWAAIHLCIAVCFLVVAVLSLVCYLFGCRTPADEQKKRIN